MHVQNRISCTAAASSRSKWTTCPRSGCLLSFQWKSMAVCKSSETISLMHLNRLKPKFAARTVAYENQHHEAKERLASTGWASTFDKKIFEQSAVEFWRKFRTSEGMISWFALIIPLWYQKLWYHTPISYPYDIIPVRPQFEPIWSRTYHFTGFMNFTCIICIISYLIPMISHMFYYMYLYTTSQNHDIIVTQYDVNYIWYHNIKCFRNTIHM